ncbi:MAG TPA: hypothetical protein VF481_16440 [Novosphingobium sp.]
MARVIALARTARQEPLEALRVVIVCGCALALIAAGHALPFL